MKLDIEKINKDFKKQVGKKLSDEGRKYMKNNVPVDTGLLRSSIITEQISNNEWLIGDDENVTKLTKTYGSIKTYSIFADARAKKQNKKYFFNKTKVYLEKNWK